MREAWRGKAYEPLRAPLTPPCYRVNFFGSEDDLILTFYILLSMIMILSLQFTK